jgi:hypothetical protein
MRRKFAFASYFGPPLPMYGETKINPREKNRLIRTRRRYPVPMILTGSAPYPLALPSQLQKHGTEEDKEKGGYGLLLGIETRTPER